MMVLLMFISMSSLIVRESQQSALIIQVEELHDNLPRYMDLIPRSQRLFRKIVPNFGWFKEHLLKSILKVVKHLHFFVKFLCCPTFGLLGLWLFFACNGFRRFSQLNPRRSPDWPRRHVRRWAAYSRWKWGQMAKFCSQKKMGEIGWVKKGALKTTADLLACLLQGPQRVRKVLLGSDGAFPDGLRCQGSALQLSFLILVNLHLVCLHHGSHKDPFRDLCGMG